MVRDPKLCKHLTVDVERACVLLQAAHPIVDEPFRCRSKQQEFGFLISFQRALKGGMFSQDVLPLSCLTFIFRRQDSIYDRVYA